MTLRRMIALGLLAALAAGMAWFLFVGLPRWYAAPASPSTASGAEAPAEPERRISARLFYVAEDGTRLTSIERDVPYGEQLIDQAREILNAQFAPAPSPLVSAVPEGTTLRALFIAQGQAFVDVSREIMSAHPGGSQNELLTIYTIVHALTLNMPAITSVQLLVDGREVDTLAGHIDVRRPFSTSLPLTIAN